MIDSRLETMGLHTSFSQNRKIRMSTPSIESQWAASMPYNFAYSNQSRELSSDCSVSTTDGKDILHDDSRVRGKGRAIGRGCYTYCYRLRGDVGPGILEFN